MQKPRTNHKRLLVAYLSRMTLADLRAIAHAGEVGYQAGMNGGAEAMSIALKEFDKAVGTAVANMSKHDKANAQKELRASLPKLQFPTPLRKMWSGAEVQQWLDEHQGD